MAEIEITLPTVQYGNVKVRATPEELGLENIAEGYSLGVAAAVYLNLFQQGFRKGASLDVDAPPAASGPITEEQAQRYLDEGLGGVSEVDGQDPEGPGEEPGKPWDNPQPAVTKPWESPEKGNAPALDDVW